jgi:hypothetical protein
MLVGAGSAGLCELQVCLQQQSGVCIRVLRACAVDSARPRAAFQPAEWVMWRNYRMVWWLPCALCECCRHVHICRVYKVGLFPEWSASGTNIHVCVCVTRWQLGQVAHQRVDVCLHVSRGVKCGLRGFCALCDV